MAVWAGGIVVVGAVALTIARLPAPLRDNPECDDFAACETACNDGRAWACYELGTLYAEGRGVAKNPPKAAALYEEACKSGSANACFQLEKNEEMLAAFEAECHAGWASSCFGLARSLEQGEENAQDPAKASGLYERVRSHWQARCEAGNAKACGSLGLMYSQGISVPADKARGLELRARACELGRAIACSLGGYQAKEEGDRERARSLLTRACELDYVSACDIAAELTEDGDAKLALYQRRADLYGALCERDHVRACWIAANIHVDKASFLPRDEDEARRYKDREIGLREIGCEQGAADDCASLGLTFEMGKLVERDIVRAQELYARACELGDEGACKTQRETLGNVIDVSIGYHTCVVKADGTVWCWGQNRDGQLGDGTKIDRDHPVQAQGVPAATAVDLYGGTTCIRTVDDQAWCWGSGFGSPRRVDGGQKAVEVAAGFDLACALRDNGDVGCSGYDARNLELGATAVRVGGLQRCAIAKGQLLCWGSVLQEFVAEPKPVFERDDVEDASVSSEGYCALFETGEAMCRAQVLADEELREVELEGVRMIGGDADAGCAMKADELWCWYLREGELKQPFLVEKIPRVKKLVIRSFEGCAVTEDERLLCWYVFNPEPEPVTFQKTPPTSPPPASPPPASPPLESAPEPR